MDNSLRLQLLRTKRELQTTINQIYNILFVTGIIVIITHIYLIYDKYNQLNNKKVKLNK